MKEARPVRRVVIKEEYVALTGDHVCAILLNQIEYWTKRSFDFDKFITEERQRAAKEGKSISVQLMHGWIYKTADEFAEETMIGLTDRTIRTKLIKLVDNGWISERNNPGHSWDRTKQYRFNAIKIAADLESIGYHLDGWVLKEEGPGEPGKPHNGASENFSDRSEINSSRSENFSDRTRANFGAIPKITSEITDRDQQQPEADRITVADRGGDENDIVVADDPRDKIFSAPEPDTHEHSQEDIRVLIGFAWEQEPWEINLSPDYAKEIIRVAGGLDRAQEKIKALSSFIAREKKAGRKMNSIKGAMNRILQMDTGGIMLGRYRPDENEKRIAEKEAKYRALYIT